MPPRLPLLLGLLCCLTCAPLASAERSTPSTAPAADQNITHALNRLSFGPRPGDVERVRQIGLDRWIEEQLTPEAIDDSALEAKLAPLATLRLPADQLLLAQVGDTADFLKQVKRQKNAKEQDGAIKPPAMALNARQQRIKEMVEASGLAPGTSIQAVGELVTAKIVRAVESKRQLQEILVDFWSNHFNLDVKKGLVRTLKIVDDRATIRPHIFGKFRDLLGATAHSPAMLIYLDNARSTRTVEMRRRNRNNQNKAKRGGINENYARELMELHTLGVDGGYTQQDVQEVARCLTGWTVDRVNGTFSFKPLLHDNDAKTVLGHTIAAGGGIRDGEAVLDILAAHPATARHIARKLCLRLVSDEPPASLVDKAAKTFEATGGDLRAVVKTIVFAPEFYASQTFRAKIKSPFEYTISTIRALGGRMAVPDASRPVARRRLVADGLSSTNPNAGARRVERRNNRKSVAQEIAAMGQPLFACQAPTGYSEDSRHWVSTGALIARLNFALAVTSGAVDGVQASLTEILAGVDSDNRAAVLDRLSVALLGREVSAATRATLEKQTAEESPVNATKLAALLLGSPEFQRR